ncbi:DoxX family protein [Mucilaginibacter dorajii]|uniref:DoxX family protein n=1 Tax=Mucilaginibacter dorajii TaxID=692994 RepID=UPI0021698592|nr:DoxX family protein [Mucilaginibacter dorajii]MCS3735444.1 hypothetical protein [Mucilaginibacter dorajii]
MSTQKIIYWVATGLFSLWMTFNAYAYLFSAEARRICVHFGFPDYFRIELGIAKILGVIVLLFPIVNSRLKEWAYAGFTITMISGFIAHISSGDSIRSSLPAIVALQILLTSYVIYQRLQAPKN